MPVNLLETPVASFLESVVDLFQSYAHSRQINLLFINHGFDFSVMVDREKLRIILSNLLSNAIKFSENGTLITMDLDSNKTSYVITMTDQGKGIDMEDQEKIFDRFYRVEGSAEEGTGLGLSLVKELTQLLDGEIEVASSTDRGTTFRITFPIINLGASDVRPISTNTKGSNNPVTNTVSKDYLILLVEDNDSMAQFDKEGLEKDYQIYRCANGEQGYQKAIEIVPNLINSDVMMPKMDGYALCKKIKGHPITDHIPFLLLTARADLQSRLEGMAKGADAYLAKPFNDNELRLVIKNILQTQKQLIDKLSFSTESKTEAGPASSHPFILSLEEIIVKNLQTAELNVDFLCKATGTSRTQLHRKIKALTGKSTIQLVTEIRLHKAEQLLRTTRLNISEIAYACGYTDPAYFAQVFSRQYACSASEFREKINLP
jgi:DNA-binding response OmpR family regulator/anti-sigma regulatory factor (Ser/Thr protein kinase)